MLKRLWNSTAPYQPPQNLLIASIQPRGLAASRDAPLDLEWAMMDRHTSLALAAAAPLARPALAHNFPARAITIMMPVAPGGPGDVLGRPLAAAFSAKLGHPVSIDDRPGAGGTIGMDFAARKRPDGHTLIIASNSTYAIAPHLYQMPHDNDHAFAPIALLAVAPSFCTVHRSVPGTSVAELVALARARPTALPTPPPASASPATWRPSCSRPRPASRCCTCPIVAAHRRPRRCSPARST
jgi:hypothetical protein